MKITNNFLKVFPDADQSNQISRYFITQSKASPHNYSDIQKTESLLLQTTEINKKRTYPSGKNQQNQILNKSSFLLEELYSHLQMTLNNSNLQKDGDVQNKKNADGMYNICKNLVVSLKKLQDKVQKMQSQKQSKIRSHKSSPRNNESKEYLTSQSQSYSNTSQCKCQQSGKIALNSIFEFVGLNTKLSLFQEENDKLKHKIMGLEIINEQNHKKIKKYQIQSIKMKQLIKQYQFCMKKDEQKQKNNYKKEEDLKKTIFYKNKQKRICQVVSQQKYDRNRFKESQHIIYQNQRQNNNKIQKNCKWNSNSFYNLKEVSEILLKHHEQQVQDCYPNPLTPNPLLKHNKKQKNHYKTQFKPSNNYNFKSNCYDGGTQKQKTLKNIINIQKLNPKHRNQTNTMTYYQDKPQTQQQQMAMKMLTKAKSANNLDIYSNHHKHKHYRYYPFQELLQEDIQHKQNNKCLQQIQTMASLPDQKNRFSTTRNNPGKYIKNTTFSNSYKLSKMNK